MATRKNKKEPSIRGQIRKNNTNTVSIIIIIVLLTLLNLGLIDWYQFRENKFNDNAESIKESVISQYSWLEQLSTNIYTNTDFKLDNDPESCTFGQWYNSIKSSIPEDAASEFNNAYTLHKEFHDAAAQVLSLASSDPEQAKLILHEQLAQKQTESIDSFRTIETYYKQKADKAHANLISRLIWAIMTDVVFAFIAAYFARRLGNRLAKTISEPIDAVAIWSKELSKGSDNLSFDNEAFHSSNLSEINTMIRSFQEMASSIQENVQVVQKVADGDMTAFVNIRSASDSLGKNLYRMVQSNDLMFAEISNIAQSVATGAKDISKASSALAESSNLQAAAVQDFKNTIEQTSNFIISNNEKAQQSLSVSNVIKQEIVESNEKMDRLLGAMDEIREASEKVSAIIKTINDIAEQTNLLALNASIEAARAGEAGKGFAVVANEVKDLAAKSSEAVEESKRLIEDTITKTVMGDTISKETSQTFNKISDNILEITKMTEEISHDGNEQKKHITNAENMIKEIAEAVESNAAASEETAAASEELDNSANALKESMQKFNLRKRVPGKPYIPPEKQNDAEFIRIAEENYRKALAQGKID